MLAFSEKGLLLRHPRAAATIGKCPREVQLQTLAASVGIVWCGMLNYSGQSLRYKCSRNANGKYRPAVPLLHRLSSFTAIGGLGRAPICGTLVAKFHHSGDYRPGTLSISQRF